MTHPSSQTAPEGHRPGVFIERDRAKMPEPPQGWVGVKIIDPVEGLVVIAYVPKEHEDRLMLLSAWEYFDARTTASEGVSARPRLQLEP